MPDVFDLDNARSHLQAFGFKKLFLEVLHWNAPSPKSARPLELLVEGQSFVATPIAEQASIRVFEVVGDDTLIQSKTLRVAIAKALRANVYESFIVFRDEEKRGCVWNWLRTEGKKTTPREHYYFRWQPGDLFLQKISRLFVDLAELDDEGSASFTAMLGKIEAALDTQAVTKKFFTAFQGQYVSLLGSISGIREEKDRRWFTSLLLNRLMFVAFLEAKGFLEDDRAFLQRHLDASVARGKDRYYNEFLQPLFFEAFATPNTQARSARARKLFSKIRYLNGGLFVKHRLERDYERTLRVPDAALGDVLRFFHDWTWTLDDRVGAKDDTINPDVLGHIFERYNNARQKEDGAYYTPPDITNYLADRTIGPALLARLDGRYENLADLYARCDASTAEVILRDVLPTFRVIDPACGSGAFLLAAFRALQEIYGFVLDVALRQPRGELCDWANELVQKHGNRQSAINERIVTQNLYGVELNQEATEVARLRMFLELIAPALTVEEIQPLPNLEYNIMQGNSLIGFRERPESFEAIRRQATLFESSDYRTILCEKNETLVDLYKTESHRRLKKHATKEKIERERSRAKQQLDAMLVREFDRLGIKAEEEKWSEKKAKVVTETRPVTMADAQDLTPFHWDYEFRDILRDGGFDVVLTNPPWETLKPQAKEFFMLHSDLVTKKQMTIKDFEKEKKRLLRDPAVSEAYSRYNARFPHQSAYFRSSPSYVHQSAVAYGKKTGSDINLYKLFTERCRDLLRGRGQCGIVIPSGIYSDLGAKGLRQMLFEETTITGLFGFENRQAIFEDVHRSFKFVVLTFEQGGQTLSFPTAFMRHDTADIREFPARGAMSYPMALVKKLSPDPLSLVELKNETDLVILAKAARFPLLGEKREGGWNLKLTREFDMTNDSHLFRTQAQLERDGWLREGNVYYKKNARCLPLFEGKMIHQYRSDFAPPKYWIEESEGRKALLGNKVEDVGQELDYETFRLVHRRIASSTNERTMIATVAPPGVFFPDTAQPAAGLPVHSALVLVGFLNSFVVDWLFRMKVAAHLDMHFVYSTPVPWIAPGSYLSAYLSRCVALLVCQASEFDDLARGVALRRESVDLIVESERLRLRAEIDAIVAHLYGLSSEEYGHVLSTFPRMTAQEKMVMQVMFDALPLKGWTRGALEALDLPRVEAASHSVDVELALKACLDAGEAERISRTQPRQLKAA